MEVVVEKKGVGNLGQRNKKEKKKIKKERERSRDENGQPCFGEIRALNALHRHCWLIFFLYWVFRQPVWTHLILSLVSHMHPRILVNVGFLFYFFFLFSMTSHQFSYRLNFNVYIYIYPIANKTYHFTCTENSILQTVFDIIEIWYQAKLS